MRWLRQPGRKAAASAVVLAMGGWAFRSSLAAVPRTTIRVLKQLGAPLVAHEPKAPVAMATTAPQMMVGPVTTKLTYAVDTSAETNLTMASTGATGGAQTSKQVVRIQGNLELTYVGDNATTGGRYLRTVMNGNPQIYQADETGTMTPVATDTTGLQEEFIVEQASTGEVRSVAFKAIPVDADPATVQRTQATRNALKGAVSLLDMRLAPVGSVQTATLTDAMGQYSAQISQVSTSQIQVVKTGYTTLAPGVGVYEVNGDVRTLSAKATLNVTGSSTITLNAQNLVQSRHIDHETLTVQPTDQPADFADSTDNNFTPNGTVQVTGDLTLQSVSTDSSAAGYSLSPFTQTESLQVQCICSTTTGLQVLKADEDIRGGMDLIRQHPRSIQGPTLIARGLMQGGSVEPLRAALKDPSISVDVAEDLAAAMGMAPTGASREVMREILENKATHPRVRRAVLDAAPGFPRVEPALAEVLERIAATRTKESEDARHALAVLVPRFREQDPARAERVVMGLVDRLDHEPSAFARVQLLKDLAATGHERAQRVLAVNALDKDVAAVAARFTEEGRVAGVMGLGAGTSKDFCNLLDTDYASYVSSQYKYCGNLFKKSAGSNWLGGDIWVGFGGGVTADKTKGAFILGGGLEAMLLKIPIGLFSAKYAALYDQNNPSNRRLEYSYDTIFGNGKSGQLSLNQSTPDDPRYPPNTIPFGSVSKSYQVCGQVFIFTLCFEAGVGANYGLQYRFDGFGQSQSSGFYHEVGPYACITAWLEGSISFLCLKLSIELRGQFLNVSYPVRMDMDLYGGAGGSPNMCLSPRFQIVPWAVQLYGHFRYCIGKKTKLLWQDSAKPDVTLYTPYCLQKSDLQVSSITWDPSVDPDASKPIAFNVTVKNAGQAQTTPGREVKVALNVNGTSIGSFSVLSSSGATRPLKAGESYTGRVVWPTPTAGTFPVVATADPGALTAELNSADNTLSVPITVKPVLPDLVVSSTKVITPATATAGAVVEVTMDNLGPGADPMVRTAGIRAVSQSRSGAASIYNGDGGGGDPIGWMPAPITFQVKSGATVLYQGSTTLRTAARVTLPLNVSGVKLATVDVVANADGRVVEKTQSNNTMPAVDVSRTDTLTPVVSLAYGELLDRPKELHRWRASIQEDGTIDRVDWYLDGALLSSDRSLNAPGNLLKDYVLCVKDLAEASHTLQVKAFDKSGKFAASAVMPFTVAHPDLISPIVTMQSVVDLYPYLTFTATASDNKSGVDHVEFYVDNVKVGSVATAPYVLRIANDTTIPMGQHSITARAVDKAGVEPGANGVGNAMMSPVVTYLKDDHLTEVEPNNDQASANGTYSYTRYLSGTVSGSADQDWWKVTVPAGKSLTVGGNPVLRVQMCTAAGVLLADNRPDAPQNEEGPVTYLRWVNTTTSDATLYLKVTGYSVYIPGTSGLAATSGNTSGTVKSVASLSGDGGRMVFFSGSYALELDLR